MKKMYFQFLKSVDLWPSQAMFIEGISHWDVDKTQQVYAISPISTCMQIVFCDF